MVGKKRLPKFLIRNRIFRIAIVLSAIGTLIFWLFGLYVVANSYVLAGTYEEWVGQLSAGFIFLVILFNVLTPLVISTCFLFFAAGLVWALNPKWKEKE